MKNKFCEACRGRLGPGLQLPAHRIRGLPEMLDDTVVNSSDGGVWSVAHSVLREARFRVVNNTSGCTRPRIAIFETPAPEALDGGNLPFAPLPDDWFQDGFISFCVSRGTLVPSADRKKPVDTTVRTITMLPPAPSLSRPPQTLPPPAQLRPPTPPFGPLDPRFVPQPPYGLSQSHHGAPFARVVVRHEVGVVDGHGMLLPPQPQPQPQVLPQAPSQVVLLPHGLQMPPQQIAQHAMPHPLPQPHPLALHMSQTLTLAMPVTAAPASAPVLDPLPDVREHAPTQSSAPPSGSPPDELANEVGSILYTEAVRGCSPPPVHEPSTVVDLSSSQPPSQPFTQEQLAPQPYTQQHSPYVQHPPYTHPPYTQPPFTHHLVTAAQVQPAGAPPAPLVPPPAHLHMPPAPPAPLQVSHLYQPAAAPPPPSAYAPPPLSAYAHLLPPGTHVLPPDPPRVELRVAETPHQAVSATLIPSSTVLHTSAPMAHAYAVVPARKRSADDAQLTLLSPNGHVHAAVTVQSFHMIL